MKKIFFYGEKKEDGFALVLALSILALMTVVGVSAISTVTTELAIVRNVGVHQVNFYNSETGAISASTDIGSTWLTKNSDLFKVYGVPLPAQTVNVNGNNVATYQAVGIAPGGSGVPDLPHIGVAPAGSGYSIGSFEIRRYAITSTSVDQGGGGESQVQVGGYKVFNKPSS